LFEAFFGGLNSRLPTPQLVWECGSGCSDQIEHEVGGNAADAAMFSLAHRNLSPESLSGPTRG
jgi:hypothetical protein